MPATSWLGSWPAAAAPLACASAAAARHPGLQALRQSHHPAVAGCKARECMRMPVPWCQRLIDPAACMHYRSKGVIPHLIGPAGVGMVVGVALEPEDDAVGQQPVPVPAVPRPRALQPACACSHMQSENSLPLPCRSSKTSIVPSPGSAGMATHKAETCAVRDSSACSGQRVPTCQTACARAANRSAQCS